MNKVSFLITFLMLKGQTVGKTFNPFRLQPTKEAAFSWIRCHIWTHDIVRCVLQHRSWVKYTQPHCNSTWLKRWCLLSAFFLSLSRVLYWTNMTWAELHDAALSWCPVSTVNYMLPLPSKTPCSLVIPVLVNEWKRQEILASYSPASKWNLWIPVSKAQQNEKMILSLFMQGLFSMSQVWRKTTIAAQRLSKLKRYSFHASRKDFRFQ